MWSVGVRMCVHGCMCVSVGVRVRMCVTVSCGFVDVSEGVGVIQ